MGNLETVSVEDLQAALDHASGKKPTMRLIAAIAYKNGVTQTQLADWLSVERKTIYNWFRRMDDAPDLVDAVLDDPRPGRPRKLSSDQQEELEHDLSNSPCEIGINESEWSPKVLQEHIRKKFREFYSLSSCRRLLSEFEP